MGGILYATAHARYNTYYMYLDRILLVQMYQMKSNQCVKILSWSKRWILFMYVFAFGTILILI